jgi:MYXO-CTERM domain-containing protein
MIGPLLRVAAGAAAARTLRTTAENALNRALLTIGAAAAIGVGAIFLTFSALSLLESQLNPAGASAIVGAFWGLLGLGYFVATRRRRT